VEGKEEARLAALVARKKAANAVSATFYFLISTIS
jgi:hypothetical protein